MSSLTFANLSVRYGRKVVVHDFNEAVRPGEWLCLIGPNGAGKSSVLRAACGLVAHSGTIAVDGSSLDLRSSRRRAALVAYVPQAPNLPADMTAILTEQNRDSLFIHVSREDRASPRKKNGPTAFFPCFTEGVCPQCN